MSWSIDCREQAQAEVTVPEEIINLLSDVRAFLQDKCEPPVYVSDRRLVKAVGLMQVRPVSYSHLNKLFCPVSKHPHVFRPSV